MCALYPMCNSGDHEVGMDCPSERECYTLSVSCGSGQYNTITCVLPQGLHCDDPLLCNPGDTQATFGDQGWMGCADPHSCYQLNLCGSFIMCRYGADAGVDAGALDVRGDVSGKPEPDSMSALDGAPHPQPCLDDEFLYQYRSLLCYPGDSSCPLSGDGWCYTRCPQGGSCAGGFACTASYLLSEGYEGYAVYVCDGPIGATAGGACRSSNDCNAGASCITPTHCGDVYACSVCQN